MIEKPGIMKKLLIVIAVLLIIVWALLFFIYKTGDIAHILLAVAGIIILFRFSLRKILT